MKCIALCLLLPMALARKSEGAPKHTMTLSVVGSHAETVAEMATVFARSDETHRQSMEAISKSLTLPTALDTLEHSSFANTSSMKKVASLIVGGTSLRSAHINKDLKGFGGLDGARKLLNDMIHESMSKYDAEIAKCTDYYAKQCALMEVARGQISAANFVAATSRALILDAQAVINQMEVDIPETKQELKDHNRQCHDQLQALDKRLKIVMGDIAVMTMILKMSDCDAKKLLQQMTMKKCEDKCNRKFVTFDHSGLQGQVNQLKSPAIHDAMAATFADLFDDDKQNDDEDTDSDDADSFFQQGPEELPKDGELPAEGGAEPPKKTKFNNPPVPKTSVPVNPCTDPDKGAPSAADKRAAKCTLKKSPQCYKLQGRFLQIQAEIADTRDDLMEQIEKRKEDCTTTRKALEDSISNDKNLLSSSQTKLAAATEKEASAGETGRQVAKENQGYNDDLVKQMKICSTNYINFETELCALRKIRGDLFKKMKPGHPGFFQDCELSKWTPEECTKKCAGGQQKLTRSVLQHPNGGCKCLPLSAEKSCNLSPCPIDCVLAQWSGWSKCSSKCGGGVQTRVRDVKMPMKYDGKPCGDTTMTKVCNVAACSKDCVLHEWTRWTQCSKDCDGGTNRRERFVKEEAEGSGKCAGKWSRDRLEYKPCAMKRCKFDTTAGPVLKCNQTLDIVLMMDGTPKSGEKGWKSEVVQANLLIDAFSGPGITAVPNIAVIHYTGPRTWSGVSKCTGKSKDKVDMEKVCKIKIAAHFEEDMKKVKATVNGLQFAPGSKLLSLALMTVKSELGLGRKTARTIVIVFIDGHPLSYRKTLLTSREIRKKARLVYVPVIKFSPLKDMKRWASRRWQENIVVAKDHRWYEKPSTATHIIANICPNGFPKLKMKRAKPVGDVPGF